MGLSHPAPPLCLPCEPQSEDKQLRLVNHMVRERLYSMRSGRLPRAAAVQQETLPGGRSGCPALYCARAQLTSEADNHRRPFMGACCVPALAPSSHAALRGGACLPRASVLW